MFEVDVGMSRRCQPRYFRTEEARQSANRVLWILGSEALLKRRLQQYNLVRCQPLNRSVVSESSVITSVSGSRGGLLPPTRLDRRGQVRVPSPIPYLWEDNLWDMTQRKLSWRLERRRRSS